VKILITGGAGFIGSKIINKLVLDSSQTYKIVVLDNMLEQIHGNTPELIDGVTYIIGDVRNESDWKKALEFNPEVILHLASETGTGQSMDEINRYTTTNIVGTSLMLDLINSGKYGTKKIILSSSRAVYGEGINDENNKFLEPKSVYAITKLTQEQLIKTSSKVPYTILRYQNVFGDGQSLNNPYTGIISIFSNLFINNKDVTIFDNGKPTRDFIYVNDVVNATLGCIINENTNYKTYDIGTGIPSKILDVTQQLKKLIDSNSKIIVTDYHRKGDIMHAYTTSNKLYKDIGWSPVCTLNEGLVKFVNWFKKEIKNG